MMAKKTTTKKKKTEVAEGAEDAGGVATAAAPGAETVSDDGTKVTVKDAGPCSKSISIEIPVEAVDAQLNESMELAIGQVDLPGFRRGRAPRRLVEKKMGAAVHREAKNQLVATAYAKAVEDHKLRVMGDPISDDLRDLDVVPGKGITFEVKVEVAPEFELPKLDGIEVKKPMIEVGEDLVDKELETLCLHEGSLDQREKAEEGDYLTGNAKMVLEDGTTHLDIPGAVIQVPTKDKEGKGMILGILVDDFAKQIKLPKAGDELTVKATGPENHEDEKIRGQKLTMTFAVERVDRIVPATRGDLVASYGLESEESLRGAMRARLEQRAAIEQQSAMRRQVAQHLIDAVDMELPARVTASQATRTMERQRMELMYRGVSEQLIEERTAQLRSASREVAVKELKLFFILDRAAEELGIEVTEAEINGRIAQIAAQRGLRPERLRQELIRGNRISTVYTQVREHKTLGGILEKAKIEEMPLEKFRAAMEKKGVSSDEAGVVA